jgi:very-short-patch-repair endonuclease
MDSFRNEEMIEQYTVLKYRIDLYFPRYKLAIECDEHHRDQFADDYREKK